MKKFCLLLLSLAVVGVALGQSDKELARLVNKLKEASDPAGKIEAYYSLSSFYFETNRAKSDSLAFIGQATADASRDRKLIVNAYLKDANRHLKNTNRKANSDEARAIVQKALALSREEKNSELIIACDNILARTYRISGESAKALQANADAVALLSETHSDSLAVQTYNSQGLTLMRKKDMVAAFKSYLTALSIAEQSNRPKLLIASYETLVDFYVSLPDYEKAKDYAFKILAEHKKGENKSIARFDYYRIGEVYASAKDVRMSLYYFTKAGALADSIKDDDFKVSVKFGIINMYLNTNHFKEGYQIIRSSPEVFEYIRKLNMYYELDKANGYIQMMLKHYDSSIFYYKRAEPFYQSNAAPLQRYSFYSQFSLVFKEMKQWDKAIAYELIAKQTVEPLSNVEVLAEAVGMLDSLYLLKGDFTTAYQYHNQHQVLRDSLQKLSKEKDLQSLEIDNENKRKERAQIQADEDLRKRHNLQYMAITVAIGGIFILLVAIGLFKVSPGVVKAMGFFAFIFLFEFIVLLADNQIHHFTHGEPWKVLMIKIGLIALLVPFHHWLEETVIHYLIEKRLVITQRLKKIIPSSSKPAEE